MATGLGGIDGQFAQAENVEPNLDEKGRARRPALSYFEASWDYQVPPVLQPPFPPLVQVRVDVPSPAVRIANDVPLRDTPVTV